MVERASPLHLTCHSHLTDSCKVLFLDLLIILSCNKTEFQTDFEVEIRRRATIYVKAVLVIYWDISKDLYSSKQ